MANTRQATRRAKQDVKRRAANVVHRTRFRTYHKSVVSAIAAKDGESAREALNKFISIADAAAGRGIVHQNKAARIKKRLNSAVKSLGSGEKS